MKLRLVIPSGAPVTVKKVEWVWFKRVSNGWRLKTPVPHLGVRITSATGVQGIADRQFKKPAAITAELLAKAVQAVVGQDARDVEAIHGKLPFEVRALVDRALWDLLGHAEGKPVHALLGGSRKSIPVYYSKGSIEYFKHAQGQSGFRAWKIHAWPGHTPKAGQSMKNTSPPLGPPSLCLEFMADARKAVGKDVRLIADCHYHYFQPKHGTWTVEDAEAVVRGLQELGFIWIEGLPFVWDKPELYARMKAAAPKLLLQNEFPNNGQHMAKLLALPPEQIALIDVQAVDVPNSFTEKLRVARWCVKNGKLFDVHWPAEDALQLAGVLPEAVYPVYEIGRIEMGWVAKDGLLAVPAVPGMGPILAPKAVGVVETVDWPYMQARRYDPLNPTPAP
jgi:L-alanine-DL-glutamate epimerase-like enolase superfamily enzyme